VIGGSSASSKPATRSLRIVSEGKVPLTGTVNYIRNSVKVVVNAYDGTMTYYVADPTDPIIQVWQKAFPDLFTPLADAPAELQAPLPLSGEPVPDPGRPVRQLPSASLSVRLCASERHQGSSSSISAGVRSHSGVHFPSRSSTTVPIPSGGSNLMAQGITIATLPPI
jgi:hypothetical protein